MICFFVSTFAFANVSSNEKEALLAIYNSTQGDQWNTPWNLNSPIETWYGVTVIDGKVIEINPSRKFPLTVLLQGGSYECFTFEGKENFQDVFPSLFWREIKISMEAVIPPTKKVWQWLIKQDDNTFSISTGHYESERKIREEYPYYNLNDFIKIPESEKKV